MDGHDLSTGSKELIVEFADRLFEVILDALLVLFTGGSVELLDLEANLSEDLGLASSYSGFKGLPGGGVGGLGGGKVSTCLGLGVLLGVSGGDEEAVCDLLEGWDVDLEDLS